MAERCWSHLSQCPALMVSLLLVCVCKVLADIEVAQSLQSQKVKEEEEKEITHPLDQDYALLCCQLSLLDPACQEYQVPLVPQYPMIGSYCALLSQGDRGHS